MLFEPARLRCDISWNICTIDIQRKNMRKTNCQWKHINYNISLDSCKKIIKLNACDSSRKHFLTVDSFRKVDHGGNIYIMKLID